MGKRSIGGTSFCKGRVRPFSSTFDGPVVSDPRDALYTTPAMAAVFAPEEHVRWMLAFEAALARAEAQIGVIPRAAAEAIGAACRSVDFDVAAIYREAALAGTPAI